MKRAAVGIVILAAAIAGVSTYAHSAPAQSSRDDDARSKTLQGSVLGAGDAPVANAVVYLKNTKTLALRSFISDDKGKFRFNALAPNVDYEVYAELNGKRSDTKTISGLDSRSDPYINLHIDTGK